MAGTLSAPSASVAREAMRILTLAASSAPGTPLTEIADTVAVNAGHPTFHEPLRLAREALAESVDAGNWREARAEGAQKLRMLGAELDRDRLRIRRMQREIEQPQRSP